MDKFFTVDGEIIAVAQDASVSKFLSLQQALDTKPVCALQARITYEYMLVRGLREQWYQNTRYDIYLEEKGKAKCVSVGNWSIKGFYMPKNADALHCDFIDPLGKIVHQEFKGVQGYSSVSQAFRKIMEVSNYESALNYKLMMENEQLKKELANLKENK